MLHPMHTGRASVCTLNNILHNNASLADRIDLPTARRPFLLIEIVENVGDTLKMRVPRLHIPDSNFRRSCSLFAGLHDRRAVFQV